MNAIPQPKRARGEMLPLMDMIFLLLVLFIFMIVQMRPDFGISMELPELKESQAGMVGAAETEQKTVVVSVDAEGKVFVNQTMIADGELLSTITSAAQTETPDAIRVVLRGDRQARYGELIEVYGQLNEAKFGTLILEVEKMNHETH